MISGIPALRGKNFLLRPFFVALLLCPVLLFSLLSFRGWLAWVALFIVVKFPFFQSTPRLLTSISFSSSL